jgi:hypothetical protein
MNPDQLWDDIALYYLITIAIETPILLVGLSKRHSLRVRVFSGVWLTACTYPVVFLVLPMAFGLHDDANADRHGVYLAVAEVFAPLAECLLFWAAFGQREKTWTRSMWCDMVAITVANAASFVLGEVMNHQGWFI